MSKQTSDLTYEERVAADPDYSLLHDPSTYGPGGPVPPASEEGSRGNESYEAGAGQHSEQAPFGESADRSYPPASAYEGGRGFLTTDTGEVVQVQEVTPDDGDGRTLAELQDEAKSRGIAYSGLRKAELAKLLAEDDAE